MNAAYCKALFALVCIIWVWTFYIEESFANYYNHYFTSSEIEQTNSNVVVSVVNCSQSEDGSILLLQDPISTINRKRQVEILSHNNSKLTLQYADLTWQVCVMLKDQAPEIAEWIEMNYLMGATHISIYDHGSTDNLTELLKVYTNDTIRKADPYFPQIELIKWPPGEYTDDLLALSRKYHNEQEYEDVIKKIAICKAGIGLKGMHASGRCQQAMIADCTSRFRWKRDWLSWHDVDELFWVPPQDDKAPHPTVSSFLPSVNSDTLSVYINALTFGTNGYQNHSEYASKLIIETHLHRAPYEGLKEPEKQLKESLPNCKTSASGWGICDKGGGKSLSRGNNAHWLTTDADSPHFINGFADITYVSYPMRMNHYQMRSVEEAETASKKQNKEWSYRAAKYASEFWNGVYDDGIAKFSPEIRKRLQERGLL